MEAKDNPHFDAKGVREFYENQQLDYWRKQVIKEVVEFIKSYIDNNGHIVEKYTSAPHYVAVEWQPIVALLDTINRHWPSSKTGELNED